MNPFTVTLNSSGKTPLYRQLYQYILMEIRSGRLKEGERLPSKRNLSGYLNISQSTVETAYEMLLAEGYIYSLPRSGFYISPIDTALFPFPQQDPDPVAQEKQQESISREILLDFSTGSVDTQIFPYATWAKLQKEILYNHSDLLLHGHQQGDLCLRRAIAKMLHEYRGVNCTPPQIVVGAGIEYLLDMLSQLLPPDACYGLENPGYPKPREIFRNNGKTCCFIPVDHQGMNVASLNNSPATVACVTPTHQFPTGVTMPVARRMELLRWSSEEANRYIIEDDYDSEFRFDTRPIPAMQGLSDSGKIIYVGTFSRSIAPSIRAAYMVLPQPLLKIYREKFRLYSSTVSRFEQHTLAYFIERGHYIRHLNKVSNCYKKRSNTLITQLKNASFGKSSTISGAKAGLHFTLSVNNGMSEDKLVKSAQREGVRVYGLSSYYLASPRCAPSSTLVLGYAGLTEQQILEAVHKLSRAWS